MIFSKSANILISILFSWKKYSILSLFSYILSFYFLFSFFFGTRAPQTEKWYICENIEIFVCYSTEMANHYFERIFPRDFRENGYKYEKLLFWHL